MALTQSQSRDVRARIDMAKEHFVMLANTIRNIEVVLSDTQNSPLTDIGVAKLKRFKALAEHQFTKMAEQLGMSSMLK